MNAGSLVVTGVIVLVLTGLSIVFVLVRRQVRARALPTSLRKTYLSDFAQLKNISDDGRRVLEAEKIIDHAFSSLGYEGTFAEKLQKAGPRLSQLQSVWEAHKLRNRIAHERAMTIKPAQAKRSIAAFQKALQDLS